VSFLIFSIFAWVSGDLSFSTVSLKKSGLVAYRESLGTSPELYFPVNCGVLDALMSGCVIVVVIGAEDGKTHESTGQGGPNGRPQPLFALEQRLVLYLEFLPVQHRVLRLFTGRSDEVQLGSDGVGFLDLLGGPFGGSPVEGFAGVDQVVEGSDGLLDGNGGVGSVGEDDVD